LGRRLRSQSECLPFERTSAAAAPTPRPADAGDATFFLSLNTAPATIDYDATMELLLIPSITDSAAA
jgi:hypothetical protein